MEEISSSFRLSAAKHNGDTEAEARCKTGGEKKEVSDAGV